jgi:hypothetical protein
MLAYVKKGKLESIYFLLQTQWTADSSVACFTVSGIQSCMLHLQLEFDCG